MAADQWKLDWLPGEGCYDKYQVFNLAFSIIFQKTHIDHLINHSPLVIAADARFDVIQNHQRNKNSLIIFSS
jgi:hypothetical protein